MTEKVINELPEILKSHICTMKKSSFDDNKAVNMSESLLKVVNLLCVWKGRSKWQRFEFNTAAMTLFRKSLAL